MNDVTTWVQLGLQAGAVGGLFVLWREYLSLRKEMFEYYKEKDIEIKRVQDERAALAERSTQQLVKVVDNALAALSKVAAAMECDDEKAA